MSSRKVSKWKGDESKNTSDDSQNIVKLSKSVELFIFWKIFEMGKSKKLISKKKEKSQDFVMVNRIEEAVSFFTFLKS